MTEDAIGPQKPSLVKTTSCAASAYPQAKESHQHVTKGGSFIESTETQNQCVTELSANQRNERYKSRRFGLLSLLQCFTLTETYETAC